MGSAVSLETKIDEPAARNLAGDAFDEGLWGLVCDIDDKTSLGSLINGLKQEAAQRAALSDELASLKSQQVKRDKEVEETLASEEKNFKHLTKLLREEGVNKARVAFERTLEAKTRVQEEHERLEALRKDLKETKVALADSEARIAVVAAERDQLSSELTTLRAKVAEGQTQREADAIVAHTLEVKLESMGQQLAAAENRAAVDESEISARFDAMQHALQAKHAAAIDALKFEIGASGSNDVAATAAAQTESALAADVLPFESSSAPNATESNFVSAASGTNLDAVDIELDLDPLEFIVSTALADFLPNSARRNDPFLGGTVDIASDGIGESTSGSAAVPASKETAAPVHDEASIGNNLEAAPTQAESMEVETTEREVALKSRLDAVDAQMVVMTDQLSAVSRQLPTSTSNDVAIALASRQGSLKSKEMDASGYTETVESSAIDMSVQSTKEQSTDDPMWFEKASPIALATAPSQELPEIVSTVDSTNGAKTEEPLDTRRRRSRRGKLPDTRVHRSRHSLPAVDDTATLASAAVVPTSSSSSSSSSSVLEESSPERRGRGRRSGQKTATSPSSAAAAAVSSPVERAMTAPGPSSVSSNAPPSRHGAFLDDSIGSVFSDDNVSMYFDDENSLDGSSSMKLPEISSSRDNLTPQLPRRPILKKKAKLHPNKNRLRDYSVLVDASSSMRMATRSGYDKRKNRWDEAREVLELLVPQVVEHDDDGISLYFFSTGYRKFPHVNSSSEVKEKFSSTRPKGGTQLADALKDAVIPDNRGRPETILVITDGAPENRQAVEKVLVDTSEATEYSDDLRVVFVQVGSDAGASRWLSTLDARLGCPEGVVNTATTAHLQDSGLSASEWVDKVVFAGV